MFYRSDSLAKLTDADLAKPTRSASSWCGDFRSAE
jgi:hypothetical protein